MREAGAGSLTITKTVTGTGFDPAKTFELTVTFDKPVTYNGTTSTTHTFNLASGQSVTITNIPENTHYEVAESPLSAADIAAGYRIGNMSGGSGTITGGGSMSASATNLYEGTMLPANTIRFRFSDASYDPSVSFVPRNNPAYEWTRVSSSPNVWDCHINTSWRQAFNGAGVYPEPIHFESYGLIVIEPCVYDYDHTKTITVVDANLTGATSLNGTFEFCEQLVAVEKLSGTEGISDFNYAFQGCSALSSVAAFDVSGADAVDQMFASTALEHAPALNTSHVSDFSGMFVDCAHLREVPLYDTSSATDVSHMFYNCTNVESGALAMYNQLAQLSPAPLYTKCFGDCGSGTTTGAAELAQIPSDWK